MKKKSPIALRIISLVLLIGWMGLIFYLSNQTAGQSSGLSRGLIKQALSIIMPDIGEEQLIHYTSALQFIVRKSAHFSLYAILGVLSFTSFVTYESITFYLRVAISFVISAAYSVSDEYHQTFVDGRSGEIRDILIDSAGALTGIVFALIIYKIFRSIKKKRSGKMKKKQYMELVDTLGYRLNKEKRRNDELTEENSSLNAQLLELKNRIRALEKAQAPAVPVIEEEEIITEASVESVPIKEEPILTDGITQGSKIIGKIVLSSAKYCNDLTALGASENAKELVNLILGRTEVAKGEILRLSALDINPNERLLAMERELNSAEDYFKSVMAQKS